MLLKNTKTLKWLLSTLLLLCLQQQLLFASQARNYSIGNSKRKNDNSFIQWGNLSGDTTDLKTFLSYDSLVLKSDITSCEYSKISRFRLIIIYADTSTVTYELKSNQITTEIKEAINKLPGVDRIIIEDIRLSCIINEKELLRILKSTLEYTIPEH